MMNMKNEQQIENEFIKKLIDLKYVYREDIRDEFSLEENFRKHFERLNRVKLSPSFTAFFPAQPAAVKTTSNSAKTA